MSKVEIWRGPVDLLWRAKVDGERLGNFSDGVWESWEEAQAAVDRHLSGVTHETVQTPQGSAHFLSSKNIIWRKRGDGSL